MLIHTVKGAIKRVIKKALFHQSTCMNSLTIAGPLLIFTISIMPKVQFPFAGSTGCHLLLMVVAVESNRLQFKGLYSTQLHHGHTFLDIM